MDIVHCLDDKYVPMCATAMESLCSNNRGADIRYHIISCSLGNEGKRELTNTARKYGAGVSFYDVDETMLDNCVVRKGDHVSLATYLRIMIPIVLPPDIERVLYLDCDLVVRGDISELFTVDLTGWACGGVCDCGTDDIRTYNRLGYSPDKGYYNAGVLVFNLTYWRENSLSDKIFRFIDEHPERLLFWDQDAINSVLAGKIKQLPFRYNMTDPFYMRNTPLRQKYLDEINAWLSDPTILHFATASKPWIDKRQPHPLKGEFYRYLALTKWSKDFPPKRSLKRRVLSFMETSLGIRIERVRPSDYLTKNEVCATNTLINNDIQMGGGGITLSSRHSYGRSDLRLSNGYLGRGSHLLRLSPGFERDPLSRCFAG